MLTGVSVSCFLLSYLVVFLMEASRFFFKVPGRSFLLIAMLVAGLLAHSIFLVNEISLGGQAAVPGFLADWFQWAVVGAWGLSLACLILTLRNPNGSIGLFLTPVILGLIGVALLLRGSAPFNPDATIMVWPAVHGVSVLVGTMFICFGLAFGLMYLVQSHRLKSKQRTRRVLRLPTLEFLQSMNRLSLFAATAGLAVGLLSGIVLNFHRAGQIQWFSGSNLFSVALFGFSLMAAITELSSRGSLGGRRSAYLAIANFVFLVLVLGWLLFSSHGRPSTRPGNAAQSSVADLADREVLG